MMEYQGPESNNWPFCDRLKCVVDISKGPRHNRGSVHMVLLSLASKNVRQNLAYVFCTKEV